MATPWQFVSTDREGEEIQWNILWNKYLVDSNFADETRSLCTSQNIIRHWPVRSCGCLWCAFGGESTWPLCAARFRQPCAFAEKACGGTTIACSEPPLPSTVLCTLYTAHTRVHVLRVLTCSQSVKCEMFLCHHSEVANVHRKTLPVVEIAHKNSDVSVALENCKP